MLNINFNHLSSEEQAEFRDMLCEALQGWTPFIDNRVVVGDTTSDELENGDFYTHLIVGEDEEKMNIDIPADSVDINDIIECINDSIKLENDTEGVKQLEEDLEEFFEGCFLEE